MSMGEIIIILIVAILVLGPEKLPSTIAQFVKIFKAVKKNIDDAKSTIEKEIHINELKSEARKYKDEFAQTNENIRKKLSFEEFDELKKEILEHDTKTNPNEKSEKNEANSKPNLTEKENV